MQSCISDVKLWTTVNKLQLNEDKTEALLFAYSCHGLPSSISVGQSAIPFAVSARNLGVIFDNSLNMRDHITRVCQGAYFEIRRISCIRHLLTQEATKTLVTSFVLSRVDYCNSLLAGIPQNLIDKLQKVLNCAARLVFRASKREHVTPLLAKLHWLPISKRIEYKICTVCFTILTGTAPPYLADLLEVYVPSRSLRSSADSRIFRIPRRHKKSHGQRAFSYFGPVTWNQLPYSIRHAPSLPAFKSQLKTHLFSSVYDSH